MSSPLIVAVVELKDSTKDGTLTLAQTPDRREINAKSARPSSAVNVAWNWAGVGIDALVGLVLTPFLISNLGDETYSIWILLGSLTGCFGMLDFGMRGAVGRFVAFHHARDDRQAVERVLSAAAMALCGMGFELRVATTEYFWALNVSSCN